MLVGSGTFFLSGDGARAVSFCGDSVSLSKRGNFRRLSARFNYLSSCGTVKPPISPAGREQHEAGNKGIMERGGGSWHIGHRKLVKVSDIS